MFMARKNVIQPAAYDDYEMAVMVKCMDCIRKEVQLIRRSMAAGVKPAYTNKEVMEMFGIASATLKKWRDTGTLGYSQKGNIYLYSKEDIDVFLKKNHYDTFDDDRTFRRFLRQSAG